MFISDFMFRSGVLHLLPISPWNNHWSHVRFNHDFIPISFDSFVYIIRCSRYLFIIISVTTELCFWNWWRINFNICYVYKHTSPCEHSTSFLIRFGTIDLCIFDKNRKTALSSVWSSKFSWRIILFFQPSIWLELILFSV